MKLDVGYYKIKWRGKHFSPISYLRVTYQGKIKYYQYDHGLPFTVNAEQEVDEMERFKILKKITKPIEVIKPTISVTFYDEDGDQCEMKARNLSAFERILEQFPRLKKLLSI